MPAPRYAYIKQEHGEYCVHSESNPDWNGGCYSSKEKAEERLRQVEFFKHKGASDLVMRVALRYLADAKSSPLERVTKDSWFMPLAKDRFVHFTTEARADQIIKSGKLLMRPPHDKFGTDTVDAVSLTYGKLVPGVQYTHITRSDPKAPIVGVVFQTDTVPKVGFREEVKWAQDVHLKSPSIVSFGEAQSLIRGSPESIPESDHVLYRKGKSG
jgi:hypothetical protein